MRHGIKLLNYSQEEKYVERLAFGSTFNWFLFMLVVKYIILGLQLVTKAAYLRNYLLASRISQPENTAVLN